MFNGECFRFHILQLTQVHAEVEGSWKANYVCFKQPGVVSARMSDKWEQTAGSDAS